MNEDQQIIAEHFKQPGILYIAGLSIMFSSVQAGILLSQLLYWNDKGWNKNGWIYKTSDDLYFETGLKRSGQETAIKVLKRYGFLEVKLAGIPAKRHFKIDMDKLDSLLTSMLETGNLDLEDTTDSGD